MPRSFSAGSKCIKVEKGHEGRLGVLKKGFSFTSVCFPLLVAMLFSCNSRPNGVIDERGAIKPNKGPQAEQRIQAHRERLQKERISIDHYLQDRGVEMERSGTGMHYVILDEKPGRPSPKPGDEAEFTYKIFLLNGTEIYSSPEGQTARLLIDKEDAEIGLHEALKLLRLGEEGLFVLPSHLAFGVAGDQEKVPPFTALEYRIKLVNIKFKN